MLAKVRSSAALGIGAYVVEVEVDLSPGLPAFSIVGLPDAAVKESRERVKAAIENSGFKFPVKRITVNLAPAHTRKAGPSFDLPIALGILGAKGEISQDQLDKYMFLGELSLDGNIRSVRGVLPMALAGREIRVEGVVLPRSSVREAAIIEGLNVYPMENLSQCVGFLNNGLEIAPFSLDIREAFERSSAYKIDFAEVKGQEHVKRGLEVSAAGGHNVIMIGPPGSGKTMLAKRIPTILAPLSLEESLEATKIHSIMGLIPSREALVALRPFRSPHHTISDVALVGGGKLLRPGEISLSHNGVLFLDELPEFNRNVLEALRQPLEDGVVTISRTSGSLTYPAKFMLAAAMNPCPCGYLTDPVNECTCTPPQIQKYMSRISGPLLDRIDIHVEVPALKYKELSGGGSGETSETIRERVSRARKIQMARLKEKKIYYNAQMDTSQIKSYCQIDKECGGLLREAIERLGLSARAYDKVLKVSRTVADLEGKEEIEASHISEAIQYRSLDRNLWMG